MSEEDLGPLVSNWMSIDGLQRLVSSAPTQLRTFCMAIGNVLFSRSWVRFYNPHLGLLFEYEDTPEGFTRFVTTRYVEGGLESTIDELRHLVKDHPKARTLLEETLARKPGGANNPHGCKGAPEPEPGQEDGINPSNRRVDSEAAPRPQHGTTIQYATRRLSRERPDLLDRVKAGEMTCNAAMILAGFRKVPTTVDVLRKAMAKATTDDLAALVDSLPGDILDRLADAIDSKRASRLASVDGEVS